MSAHRMNDLLGMRVRFADGRDGEQVTEVRLEAGDRTGGTSGELVVSGFIIGKPRPGTLFGYVRHPSMGPWLIRVVVRAWHRHTGWLEWDDVQRVDWEGRVLWLRANELRQLPSR